MVNNRIVEDGMARLLSASRNRKKIDEAVLEIRTRYAPQMNTAGFLDRIRLWFRMRREIRAAVERIAPSRGCYLTK